MTFAAAAVGIGASVAGGLAVNALSGGGGGGGSAPQANSNGSIGQGIGNILAGGLSGALGISGLVGGNANQLQAGAAASNPFGSQANQYYPILQQLLGGGITGTANQNALTQTQLLQYLEGTAGIGTNTGALSAAGNIGTPGQTSAIQNLINNPTQLISSLQGGGVQLPSSIQSILSQNPYQLTSGQQFQETQGLANLNRSLAQTGQIGSGNQYAAAEQYGQNFANQAIQQNITNLLGAQTSANQTSTTNQGLQSLVTAMGQNQVANNLSLAQLLSGQQQNTFSNQLGTQQLQSTQQQNTQQNLGNILTQLMGIGSQQTGALESLLSPLLTATQASTSSPATAGGILANLGVANQASGSNLASGLAGLGQGLGQVAQGLNFGSGGSNNASGSFSGGNFSGAFVDPSSGYSGGGNSFGFTV
jgi:hypothetical protein